ncbi:MAG: EscU/YscU/HrcU family type III secretion system export apparatus switch protein [Alphaproteobacteria bacterium]|nr:EscU/YscU/HrcU family type III secretion system export apparatus switch protein [Alphaproteobacteria bacterium]
MSQNSKIAGAAPQKAVALELEGREGPRILAKGRGALAEEILRLAFDHGVKVREDADLAEILEQLDIDSPIPLEALPAVMEILHYLYRMQGRTTPAHAPADAPPATEPAR